MSITVARIENIFWDNNSYKKPNSLPNFVESKVFKLRPVIYDFMGGRTHLRGDQWNYAIHEGVYYFLKIDKTYDVRRGHHSYVLIRDIWMNILLKNTISVKGRLLTTSRDEWLEANLNRTIPLLEDPVRVTRISLGEESFNLSKHVTIREATKSLPVVLLSKREIDDFKISSLAGAKLFKVSKDNGFFDNRKTPIFIFGSLNGFETNTYSWKENIKKRINNFLTTLKELRGKPGHEEDIVISRVGEGLGSLLKDKYCITWKTGGIGVAKETIKLHEIDLSGLEDIVQLNFSSLRAFSEQELLALPYMKKIDESLFENYFDFKYGGQETYKVRRKIYFPFTQTTSHCGLAQTKNEGDNPIESNSVNWAYLCPQKVNTTMGTIFLPFLNDVDFTLSYFKEIYLAAGYGTSHRYFTDDSVFQKKPVIKWTYPHHSYDDISDTKFYERTPEIFTPLGFLIFGFFNYKTFEGFKCKADGELGRIQYISGLRNSQLRKIFSGDFFEEYKSPLYELPYKATDRFNYSVLPNENWLRFWHNVTSSLELLLLVNGKGYTYSWRAWRPTDKLSYQYPVRALQTDQEAWNPIGAPFKDAEKHKATVLRSYELIDKLAMKTVIDIPFPVKKDDYLFTDMEYWLDKFDIENFATKWGDVSQSLRKAYYRTQNLNLEDFLHNPGRIRENINSLVLTTTLEGDIEFRTMKTFALTHRLHGSTYSEEIVGNPIFLQTAFEGFNSGDFRGSTNVSDLKTEEQGVKDVDEATSRKVGYMLLKKLNDSAVTDLNTPGKKFVNKAIFEFLKLNNYIVSAATPLENDYVANVLMLTDSDFDGTTPMLFDLVGTEWYAFIKGGRISLIAKNTEIFDKNTDEILTVPEKTILKEMSVIEKVNQKCVLTVRTHERKLKTRFKFDGDSIDLSVSNIVTAKNSITDYFFLTLRGDFDVIEKDIIAVPKSQLDSSFAGNVLELENLRVQMLRNDRDFAASMERDILLGSEKLTEEYRHQERNLQVERMQNFASTFFSTLQSIFAMPKAMRTVSYLRGGAMIMGGIRGIADTGFSIFRTEEKIKHMEREREFSFRQLAYNSLQVQLTHRDFEENSIRRINEVAHVYRKGTINDTDLMLEFRKNTEDLEENKEIFLTVFTPSGEQLRLLEAHKEEYGVDCDIPVAIVTLRDSMEEEIIKFKNLDDEGLIGLENLKEREFLMASLEMGLKVVDVTGNPPLETNQFVCTNIYKLSQQLEDSRTNTLNEITRRVELEEEVKLLQADIETKKAELEELQAKEQKLNELTKEHDKLKNEHQKTTEQITKLNEQLGKLQADIEAKRAAIVELQAKEQKLNELTKEHDKLKNEHQKTTEQIGSLDQQLKEFQGKLKKTENDLEKCNEDIKTQKYNAELQAFKAKLYNFLNTTLEKTFGGQKLGNLKILRNTFEEGWGQLSTNLGMAIEGVLPEILSEDKKEILGEAKTIARRWLEEKIKSLELENEKDLLDKEIKKHKIDLEEAEQKWDDCKRDYLNVKTERDRLQAEKTKLDEEKGTLAGELKSANKKKEALTSEINGLRQQIEDLKNKTGAIISREDCNTFQEAIAPSRRVNDRIEEDGFNPVAHLAFYIAKAANWIRSSRIDASISKISRARDIFEIIEELEGIPIIDKAIEAVSDSGWNSFWEWLEKGGNPSENIDTVIKITNTIKSSYMTRPMAIAIRGTLDELLWEIFIFLSALKEGRIEIGPNLRNTSTPADLQVFCDHFFPGQKLLPLYRNLFREDFNELIARNKMSRHCFELKPGENPFATYREWLKKDWFSTVKVWSDSLEANVHFTPTKTITPTYTVEPTKITPLFFPINIYYPVGATFEKIGSFTGRFKHTTKNLYYKRATVVFKTDDPELKGRKLDHWIGFRLEQSNPFQEVFKERENLWRRKYELFPSRKGKLTEAFWMGEIWASLTVSSMVPDPRGNGMRKKTSAPIRFNISKLFGPKTKDALILLAILATTSIHFKKEVKKDKHGFQCWSIGKHKVNANLESIMCALSSVGNDEGSSFYQEISEAYRNAAKITFAERDEMFFSNDVREEGNNIVFEFLGEFSDVYSLINYVYSVVDSGQLKNTFFHYCYSTDINTLVRDLQNI